MGTSPKKKSEFGTNFVYRSALVVYQHTALGIQKNSGHINIIRHEQFESHTRNSETSFPFQNLNKSAALANTQLVLSS